MMASCPYCGNRNLVRVRGERNTCCSACNVSFYGGGTSALKCRQCADDTYFHEFCLQNNTPVSFKFADNSERINLSLVSVPIGGDSPLCEVCGDSMRGSSRYSSPTRNISVHPSCAVNFVPTQNGINQAAPEQLRNFLNGHRHQDFDNCVIELYGDRPGSVGECMLCGRVPRNTLVTAKWWYVMTRDRQQLGGCHVGCVKRKIARNRSSCRLVDLETYYDSINGQSNTSSIETAQKVLELVIGVTLIPPLSTVLIFLLKIMAAAVSIYLTFHFILFIILLPSAQPNHN